ncbi:DUF1294 domain-containing protein [Crateriforma conspicua]|uniref:DUF1294 domain-containing protein n=1 Tax=Crateriforma conspicua TaxID=2527996 RepID=A0A5C5YBM2_9PLAN|nr:DUF1294 domain-containing protein [Crateriforma conspicua]QDV61419.1 hypothetical protein Mal65_05420 [Crateriforma conspicua]TWT72328.1 hypothetical protein Pan14r_46480 [Crateriforma conspicua]
MLDWQIGWMVVVGWVLVFSSAEIAAYGWDKWSAIRNRRRIPESTLVTIAALGGWPGGMLASRWFRHKTIKGSYRVKFAVATVVNLAILATLVYLFVC